MRGLESSRETCTACAGTMILEMAALSRLSGEPVFEVCYTSHFSNSVLESVFCPFLSLLCYAYCIVAVLGKSSSRYG